MIYFINNSYVLIGILLLTIGSLMMFETLYVNLSRVIAGIGVALVLFGMYQKIKKESKLYKEHKKIRRDLDKG